MVCEPLSNEKESATEALRRDEAQLRDNRSDWLAACPQTQRVSRTSSADRAARIWAAVRLFKVI